MDWETLPELGRRCKSFSRPSRALAVLIHHPVVPPQRGCTTGYYLRSLRDHSLEVAWHQRTSPKIAFPSQRSVRPSGCQPGCAEWKQRSLVQGNSSVEIAWNQKSNLNRAGRAWCQAFLARMINDAKSFPLRLSGNL